MNATKESEEERRRKNYFYPALDQDRAGAMLIKNTMNRRIMAWSPRSQNASVNDKVNDKDSRELSADAKRGLIRRVNREVNNQLNPRGSSYYQKLRSMERSKNHNKKIQRR